MKKENAILAVLVLIVVGLMPLCSGENTSEISATTLDGREIKIDIEGDFNGDISDIVQDNVKDYSQTNLVSHESSYRGRCEQDIIEDLAYETGMQIENIYLYFTRIQYRVEGDDTWREWNLPVDDTDR